jgi:hypothetical protein
VGDVEPHHLSEQEREDGEAGEGWGDGPDPAEHRLAVVEPELPRYEMRDHVVPVGQA